MRKMTHRNDNDEEDTTTKKRTTCVIKKKKLTHTVTLSKVAMVSPGLLKQRALAIERQAAASARLLQGQLTTQLGKKRNEALLLLGAAAAASSSSSSSASSSLLQLQQMKEEKGVLGDVTTTMTTTMMSSKNKSKKSNDDRRRRRAATQPLLDAIRATAKERGDLALEEQRRPGTQQVGAALALTNLKRKAEAISAVVARVASVQDWERNVVPGTVIWVDKDGVRQRSAVDLEPRIRKALLVRMKEEMRNREGGGGAAAAAAAKRRRRMKKMKASSAAEKKVEAQEEVEKVEKVVVEKFHHTVRWLPLAQSVAEEEEEEEEVVTEAMVRAVDADDVEKGGEKGIVKRWTWSKIRKHCRKDRQHLLPVEEPTIARFGAVFVFRPQPEPLVVVEQEAVEDVEEDTNTNKQKKKTKTTTIRGTFSCHSFVGLGFRAADWTAHLAEGDRECERRALRLLMEAEAGDLSLGCYAARGCV